MQDAMRDDQLLQGDAESFGFFYARHARAMLGYLRVRTGDIETAADLTAEVFLEAFMARHRFKPDGGPARAWLFGIANHRLAMSYRKQRRARAAMLRLGLERVEYTDTELERAEELLAGRPRAEIIAGLVEDLPDHEHTAVLARIVNEDSYERIAEQEGVSQAVSRKRVSRALARLGVGMSKE
jgi:RNA polymerase sigma factor (sigma-70 family)